MKTIQRSEAIENLHARFLEMVDDDHCLCQIAAREGFFCGGFAQWSFPELKQRYAWMVKNRPRITREELEDLANRWQLARQFVLGASLSCDVQCSEMHHQTCSGWDTFSNEDLTRYYGEVLNEEVEVVADPEPADV